MKTIKIVIGRMLTSNINLAIWGIFAVFLTAHGMYLDNYGEPKFNLLDRKRVQEFVLESNFMYDQFQNEPYDYDFEMITRNICRTEGIKMEVYNDIGTPTTYCGIPKKDRDDWTYQDFYWAANTHIRKAAKIILDIYGNITPERMEGLLSYDYNTPITRPIFRNKTIIEAIKRGNRDIVEAYMMKYNTPQSGHIGRRLHELDLIFNN